VSRVDDAADQLRQSADVLKNASCCRHLLTDVSGYCTHDREAPVASKTVVVRGFNDDEIAGVGAALIDRLPEGDRRIDKMTLCWRNVTFVDGVAVAIAERALSVVRPNVTSIFNYSGWTVEGYPHRQSAYRDLQLSHGARSLDWIVTSFNNRSSPETFFKGGDEIRRV
jgi:hypothetical protein